MLVLEEFEQENIKLNKRIINLEKNIEILEKQINELVMMLKYPERIIIPLKKGVGEAS